MYVNNYIILEPYEKVFIILQTFMVKSRHDVTTVKFAKSLILVDSTTHCLITLIS